MAVGIEQRHSASCRASEDRSRRCTCSTRHYRAWVFDPHRKKRIWSTTYPSQAAAAAWRVETRLALKNRRLVPTPRPLLREAFTDARAGIEGGSIMTRRGTPFAPGSIRNLEADFRNHVDPYFGAARLDEIDRGDLQRWIRGLTSGELSHLKRPLSPSAVANCLKPVRLVFRVEAENDDTFSTIRSRVFACRLRWPRRSERSPSPSSHSESPRYPTPR